MKLVKRIKNIILAELNPITQVALLIPVYIITLYRGYNFEINSESILYTVIVFIMAGVYLYINRDKI